MGGVSHRSHAKISEGVGHDILAIRGGRGGWGGGAMRPPEGPKGAGESRDGAPEAPSGAPQRSRSGRLLGAQLGFILALQTHQNRILDASWGVLGVSCGGFGASWGLLSASRALLGASHGDGYGIRKAYKQYRRPKRLLAIWGHLGYK